MHTAGVARLVVLVAFAMLGNAGRTGCGPASASPAPPQARPDAGPTPDSVPPATQIPAKKPRRGIIVVAGPAFQPAFRHWQRYRAVAGYRVDFVPPRPTADQTKSAIVAAAKRFADRPTERRIDVGAVVIAGDMPVVGRHPNLTRQVPTYYPQSRVTRPWGAPPTIASDFQYGDFDSDGFAEAAVGRLPFGSAAELESYLQRVIDFETSRDFGPWRSRVQLTGGVGGFGVLADAAIESVTRSIVTGVLPISTKTTVAYASPGHRFYPPGNSFRDAVIDRYNDGCAYWVYAGHGWIDHLDKVPPMADGQPVLDVESVGRLRPGGEPSGAASIAVMLSCYTGAIDAGRDALAEAMLATPGGPIAVLAGSRVTMPYGNATAALGLIDGVFQQQLPTLGQAWRSATRTMNRPDAKATGGADRPSPDGNSPDGNSLDGNSRTRRIVDAMAAMVSPTGTKLSAERREHVRLYNLIGDPTLHLHHPSRVEIDAPPWQDASNDPLDLGVTSPIDGTATVTIERPIGIGPGDRDPNGHVVHKVEFEIKAAQTWRPEIRIDATLRGQFVVRVHVAGADHWATAAIKIARR